MLTAAPPTGTVTFLFTDMEGSTRLWDEHPDAMNAVLARHDDVLSTVVGAHDGYVFSQAGDGWGIAFPSATDGVQAALEIQRRIGDEDWPEPITDIRLRMGLHAGTANERGGDFFGTTVNRAARVSAAANGGQVFLTDAVRALIADEVSEDWRLRDLGEHRLRDLTRAEHLWQIDTPDVAAPAASLTPRALTGNLPKAGPTVIGRSAEVDAIVSELESEPVVTLVGVGGVGKTTLALEVARTLADDAPGGAWFVDLTTVEDPDEVASWIAASAGVARRPDMDDLGSLVDGLATGDRVVVVDNAEHLIDRVAAVLDAVASGAPKARILVTSREPLAIDGEIVHRVHPLPVGEGPDAHAAGTLFTERALVAAPDLDRAAFSPGVVDAICRHLDGLPLAIELAAAQAETMTPDEILAALESGELAMRSRSRSTAERHRSLDDLVAWSYDRLPDDAKRVFERLSIFVGGATADAAAAVCADDEISPSDVRSILRLLVRKSMVTTNRSAGQTRFTMLETLHRYAERRRDEEPSNLAAEERHARWYADFSERTFEGLASPAEGEWLMAAVREVDNLSRAARWACAHGDDDILGEVGKSLPALLESQFPPGVTAWIDLALDTLPADHPGRIDYAYAVAYVTLFQGDLVGWIDRFDEAVAALHSTPRADMLRDAFRMISAFFRGDMDTVIAHSPDVARRAYELGDQRMAGSITADYGLALFFEGDTDRAWQVADELSAQAAVSGIPTALGWSLYLLGELSSEPDPVAAMEYLEESVEYGVAIEADFLIGISLIALAATAGRHGDEAVALDAMHRALTVWHGLGNRPQFWTAIRNLVEILHRLGSDTDAYTLHLTAEAAADEAPELFGPYGDRYRHMIEEITGALAPADAARARRGAHLSYHDTARFALDVVGRLLDESAGADRTSGRSVPDQQSRR